MSHSGSRHRRVLSRRVVLASVAALAVGLMSSAVFAGVATVGVDKYYSYTDGGGGIHCTGDYGAVATYLSGYSPGIVETVAAASTYQGILCPNSETQPAGYIKAKVTILKDGAVCDTTTWYANTGTAFAKTLDWYWLSCSTGSYQAYAEANIAMNFDWRYKALVTSGVTGG